MMFYQISPEVFLGERAGAWIGLNEVNTEGKFYWSDGTHVTYTKWASNQPDDKNYYQNCVEMRGDARKWEDEVCGKHLPLFAKRKPEQLLRDYLCSE